MGGISQKMLSQHLRQLERSGLLERRVLPGRVYAMGRGAGLSPAVRPLGIAVLPVQLAVAFRGVLSFWTAGEQHDKLLSRRARAAAAAVLLI